MPRLHTPEKQLLGSKGAQLPCPAAVDVATAITTAATSTCFSVIVALKSSQNPAEDIMHCLRTLLQAVRPAEGFLPPLSPGSAMVWY